MVVKRLLDYVCAGISLAVLSPLFFYIARKIRRDTPGPVLFRQTRVGRNGELFTMLKFRTYYQGEITRTGDWLRSTHLDELPQILNILWGNMSLVGPRPLVPEEVEKNLVSVPLYGSRHNVLPGITGLAQIQKDGRNLNQSGASLPYDLDYIGRRTTALDLYILSRTC